jgi:hypothetical protein
MARSDIDALARRARRSYELGRLRNAVRATLPLALALLVAAASVETWQAATLAGLAFIAVVAGRSYGRAIGRGVQTGVVAGMVPLFCPLVVTALGHHCAGCAPTTPMPLCLAACAGAGALAALWSGSRPGGLRSPEAISALATAGLIGAVGCLVAGGFGLLGLAAGMVLGGVPSILVRATR